MPNHKRTTMQRSYSYASSNDSRGRGTGRSQQSSRVNSAGGRREQYSPERRHRGRSRSPDYRTTQQSPNAMEVDEHPRNRTNNRRDQAQPEIDNTVNELTQRLAKVNINETFTGFL